MKSNWFRDYVQELYVASFAEAWIEIIEITEEEMYHIVASFAEAWIEIVTATFGTPATVVASFAEAWIEIGAVSFCSIAPAASPPSRRRGLKSFDLGILRSSVIVASFAEAWIEIRPEFNDW